jgi:hypothetical protein
VAGEADHRGAHHRDGDNAAATLLGGGVLYGRPSDNERASVDVVKQSDDALSTQAGGRKARSDWRNLVNFLGRRADSSNEALGNPAMQGRCLSLRGPKQALVRASEMTQPAQAAHQKITLWEARLCAT